MSFLFAFVIVLHGKSCENAHKNKKKCEAIVGGGVRKLAVMFQVKAVLIKNGVKKKIKKSNKKRKIKQCCALMIFLRSSLGKM